MTAGFVTALLLTITGGQGSALTAIDDVVNLPADRLAARLLPAELSGRVVDRSVNRQFLPGHVYHVMFWERAEPSGPMLCRRREHVRRISNSSTGLGAGVLETSLPIGPNRNDVTVSATPLESRDAYASSYPAEATAQNCQAVRGYIRPAGNHTPQIEALNLLTLAMSEAASGQVTFRIDCAEESVLGVMPCVDGRQTLERLSLDNLFAVSDSAMTYAQYYPGPDRPTLPGVPMQRAFRLVDELGPGPMFMFSPSPPDGKSWRVMVVGEGNRIRRVWMYRTTVIYH